MDGVDTLVIIALYTSGPLSTVMKNPSIQIMLNKRNFRLNKPLGDHCIYYFCQLCRYWNPVFLINGHHCDKTCLWGF